jgi:hypothetical protein
MHEHGIAFPGRARTSAGPLLSRRRVWARAHPPGMLARREGLRRALNRLRGAVLVGAGLLVALRRA